MSLLNFILTSVHGCARSDHQKFMQHLTSMQQEALCGRIVSLSWQEVLADWGYAIPISEPTVFNLETITGCLSGELSPHNPPTLPVEIPSQTLGNCTESTNYVPVVHVASKDALPWLTPVPELTEEDNIILSMVHPRKSTHAPQSTHTASIFQCFMTKHYKKIEERDTLLFTIMLNKKDKYHTALFLSFFELRHDLRSFLMLEI